MKIVKTLFLKAQPAHVWKFLTEADKLATWFHAGEADAKKDGEWVTVSNSPGKEGERICYGRVIEFDPPKKFVHVFTHQWLQGIETICTWTLEKADGGTHLTLVHDGWEKVEEGAFDMAANHDVGWDEHFARLRKVVS